MTWRNAVCKATSVRVPTNLFTFFDREGGETYKRGDTDLADEAIGMPLSVECRDVVFHDGFVAAAALGREHVEVVGAAVGLPIPFVESVLPELLAALGAEEVLRVPGLLERRHAFLENKRDCKNQRRRVRI